MVNILVVEDDEYLNKITVRALNSAGYNAVGALNANEAYEKMYNTLYDLIVSDIMMPGIDGFELAKTIRDINKTIPIILMTAKDDFASKQKGFQYGIDDYMTKPVNLDELVLRVGALLRRANIAVAKKLTVGNLTLDADATTAEINCVDVPVTTR